jgi:hypothetical protein
MKCLIIDTNRRDYTLRNAFEMRYFVSPVKYELGFYIPDDILRSDRRENLKSYIALTGWTP